MELPSLIRSLTLIDDRRNNKNKRYPLPLLLLIAFCASISKHDSWYTMQDYALAHEASIRELYKQLFGARATASNFEELFEIVDIEIRGE